jgi:hypothetical protein
VSRRAVGPRGSRPRDRRHGQSPRSQGPTVEQLKGGGRGVAIFPSLQSSYEPHRRAFSKLKAFLSQNRRNDRRGPDPRPRKPAPKSSSSRKVQITSNPVIIGTIQDDRIRLSYDFSRREGGKDRWERVAALSSAARVGSGVR